ncbi:CPBP family intramembrane glutamic endopeptidase [Terrisporobacter vanillatitrophus]|uniref:CPBP family intramembrane glutamic endopeptidase n=1 Tax=Terrisporobacter vanillatitrophus TaxID=3058402 RepID=UPI00336861E7
MEDCREKSIKKIIVLLVFLQLLLFTIEQCFFIFFKRTDYFDSMVTMFGMIVITILFIIFTRKKNISLSILPNKFGMFYILITIIATILLIATPSNFTGGIQPITLLVYGSIVTPVFEELIFRGYVWNKLNTIFLKEWKTYIVCTLLFALWHIGYISSIAFRVENGLAKVMIWKVITGLCFGIILGAVRLKAKNTYSTILLHGVLNIFGR